VTDRERLSLLREFHRHAQQTINNVPTEPSAELAISRARLVLEETFELCSALGVQVNIVTGKGARLPLNMLSFGVEHWRPFNTVIELKSEKPVNFVNAVDAMRDIEYTVISIDLALGTAEAAVETFEEVHRSNMAKESGGEDAKAVKRANWRPPRIAEILRRIFPKQKILFR
jgi:predicted HAD superfamily Cof-like phosphohydrolase